MKNKLIGKKFYLRVPANYHPKNTIVTVVFMCEDSDWVRIEPVDCPANPSRFDIEMALLAPVKRERRCFGLLKPLPWWKEECNIFADITVSATCKTRLMNELLAEIDTRMRPRDDKDAIIQEFIHVVHAIQIGLVWAKKGDLQADNRLMRETCIPLVQALQERLTVKQNDIDNKE